MTLYRLADNLAIRVGRDGLWIWAPDVSDRPIHLDPRTLTDMGLHLGAWGSCDSTSNRRDPNPPPEDPSRTA
jgi:hypothetical protein